MEQIFEIIGPVAFILFLAFGKLLEVVFRGKGEGQQSGQNRRPPSRQPGQQTSGSDAQEVQDKIRRLIMERSGIEVDEEDDGFGKVYEPEPHYQTPEPVIAEPPPRPPVAPSPLRASNQGAYAQGNRKGRKTSYNMKRLGLDSPSSLKRAILLKEILDSPLALREDRGQNW